MRLFALLLAAVAVLALPSLAVADATGPTLRFKAPLAGATVKVGTVVISMAVGDADGIQRVAFLDGGKQFANVKVAPWQAKWDTRLVAQGLHDLRVLAYDLQGNQSQASIEVLVGAPTAPAWAGDFSTWDLSQWQGAFGGVFAMSEDRITVGAAPGAPGAAAGRFEVQQGDQPVSGGDRAEVLMQDPRVNGMRTGDMPRYYRWMTYLPEDFTFDSRWITLTQWHQSKIAGPSPLKLALDGRSGELQIHSREFPGDAPDVLAAVDAAPGTWHEFVVGIDWSPDAAEGWVEAWHDGEPVLPRTARATQYALADGTPVNNHFKQGLYRDATIPFAQSVFLRGTEIGPTLLSVTSP